MTAATKRKKPSLEGFLTTRQVCELYPGLKQNEVQRAIKKGHVQAQQIGYFWVIWEGDLPDTWPAG